MLLRSNTFTDETGDYELTSLRLWITLNNTLIKVVIKSEKLGFETQLFNSVSLGRFYYLIFCLLICK